MTTKKELATLESILFLRAIKEHSTKAKAAEALGTSIDTIKKYTDNLEAELGVKLIHSDEKGSRLTQAGERIVEKSERVKELLDEIYNIRLENNNVKGEVRVLLSLGCASYMVSQELSELLNQHPELSIYSRSEFSTDKLDDVDVVLTFEDIKATDDFVLIAKREVPCGFFASSQYLAQKGYPLDMEDMINNHRFAIKNNNFLELALGKSNIKKAKVSFCSNNMLAIISAIENSAGIGILPLSYTSQGLVCLDNIPCSNTIIYQIYANKDTKDIPRVRTLINFYKEIIDKL